MVTPAPLALEPSLTAIPPGSVDPGNLYVDLQTRTIWLGVNESVHPSGAVLLSDILAMIDLINSNLSASFTYTDNVAQTLIKRDGTQPPTADIPWGGKKITNLANPSAGGDAANKTYVDAAVAAGGGGGPGPGPGGAAYWQKGMIVAWAGLASDIGIYNPVSGVDLTDWHLCDGTFGTPNLVNKFIYGAGKNNNLTVNNGGNLIAPNTGTAHSHPIAGTKLTVAQIPPHAHTIDITSGNESASHTHAVNLSGTTTADGAHTHSYQMTGSNARYLAGSGGGGNQSANTGSAGSHSHGFTVIGNTGGRSATHTHRVAGNTSSVGGSGTTAAEHTHTISSGGEHTHTILMADHVKAIPYYALCYIMRLSTQNPALMAEGTE